jgi:hypothetical protein
MKLLGALLMSTPFVGLFIVSARSLGWEDTLLLFYLAGSIVCCVSLGAWLWVGGAK